MANLIDRIEDAVDSGIKGVLDFPNWLRDRADKAGEAIYGGLYEGSSEYERIARDQAEEFYTQRAGGEAGRFLYRYRLPLLVFAGFITAVLIFAFRK